MTTPLLILSDSVAGVTGLGRIARELADRIHADLSDVFKVGVAGVGGNYTSKLPYPNYPIQNLQNMVPLDLPNIFQDFAGDEKGILLTIWNHSWLNWLAQPERLPQWTSLRDFLGVGATKPETLSDEQWNKLSPQMQKILGRKTEGPFKKWLYCPVDGDLPDGTLGHESIPILSGFDRVLAYTPFGAKVIANTLKVPSATIPNLPHGLDSSVFYPRDRKEARETFISRLSQGNSKMPIYEDVCLVGCIATNSFRKDWGLALETCLELLKRGKNVFLWGHTNGLGGDNDARLYWNLLTLAEQFGMGSRVCYTTHNIKDEDLAFCYSALDVSLGIGSGEGMGYPLMESLACGVPCVHGNYAGGADFVPKEFLVDFPAYRLESKWMIRRPAYKVSDWADAVERCLTPEMKALAKIPEDMIWGNLWPKWRTWLCEGIGVKRVVEAQAVLPAQAADVVAS